jgi:hypothetical protein
MGDGVLVGVGDKDGDGGGGGEGVADGVRVAEGDGGIEVETNVGTGVPSRTLAINSLKRQLCKSETPAAAPKPMRKCRRLNLRIR